MKRFILIIPLAVSLALQLRAADPADETPRILQDQESGLVGLFSSGVGSLQGGEGKAPQLDPKRIINESNNFLKEREPDMTAEEFTIYEKISAMLGTNVELGLKMLEGMMDEKTQPSPAFDFLLGNIYYAANQADRAEKSYLGALKRYPNFLRAWNNLGILYYTNNRFAEAVPCFVKCVNLGDRNAATYGLLGYSLEKNGDIVAAEIAYQEALGLDPTNNDWREGLLRICISVKQFDRAERLIRVLINAHPEDKRYWLDFAGILLSQKRKLDAMVVLEEANEAGAAGPNELALLGDLYAEHNLAAPAAGAYRKVLAADKTLGEQKLLQFARVLIATGRLPEAEQTLTGISDSASPVAKVGMLRIRADLLMAKKKWTEARQEIEALLALKPLDGEGLLSLGRTYMEENNLPRAALAFEAASNIKDTTYQACLELANIELKNRHYAKSAQYLNRALSIRKTDDVEDALARIKTLVARNANSG